MRNIFVGLVIVTMAYLVVTGLGWFVPATWTPVPMSLHTRGLWTLLTIALGVFALWAIGWVITDNYNGNPYSGMQPRPPIPDPPPAPPMSGKSEPLKNERMW